MLYELTCGPESTIYVLYVHGWKHDDTTDDDRKNFKTLLQHIDFHERIRNPSSPRRVVGTFVAWPGKSISVPIVENLTFWSRAKAADRIAQSAALTRVIGSIRSIVRRRASANDDFVVVMGHSFGARIALAATSQIIVYNLQSALVPATNSIFTGDFKSIGRAGEMIYEPVEGAADLEILINPAISAARFTAIATTRRSTERFSPVQQPILLAVSTENDWATKHAFPLGQRLTSALHVRELTSLGNYDEYQSHLLSAEPNFFSASDFWYDNFCSSGLCLLRKKPDDPDRDQPGNPFIVARTTSDVINGHSLIWERKFTDWLISFIFAADDQKRQRK